MDKFYDIVLKASCVVLAVLVTAFFAALVVHRVKHGPLGASAYPTCRQCHCQCGEVHR